MHPLSVRPGATAIRPSWSDLPPQVRDLVEARCGSRVVAADSQGGGFTPGFASRLLLSDGRRVFVKAADEESRSMFAEAYRKEARIVARLPPDAPAARVQWSSDGDGWTVVAYDDIDGRHPARPWNPGELRRVLDALGAMADALTPEPEGLDLPTFAAEFADLPSVWEGDELGHLPHADEAGRLARHGLTRGTGDSVVHADARDDNLLIDATGKVWLCDWNFLCTGPAWFDALCVLLSACGDGLDADALLSSHPQTRQVPTEDVDGMLALLAGYFRTSAAQPVPETSPHLRTHQRWYADVTWAWLRRRKGWS